MSDVSQINPVQEELEVMKTDKEDAEVTESDKEEVQISDRSRWQSTSGTRTLTPTRGGGDRGGGSSNLGGGSLGLGVRESRFRKWNTDD